MLHGKVSHRGVPIGTVDVNEPVGVVTVEFTPLPAFELWRPLAASVGQALRAVGFFGVASKDDSTLVPERRSAALDAGASWGRDLELRNERGELVPTMFIEVAEVPDESPAWHVAWIGFQTAGAAIPAARRQPGALGGT